MDLQHKVAIVTGGAQGIGKAITLKLAQEKAIVVINYNKSSQAAEELVDYIQASGGTAMAVQADVSQYDQAKKLIDETIKQYGQLNIVVNNAGITDDALILRMQEDQFDRVVSINLKGVWNICKHAAKPLLKSGYGRVVNITSVAGILGNAGQSNYSAAKAGVIGLTKALAREFASRKVTVNAVAPGFIETNMTLHRDVDITELWLNQIPLKRFGQVDEIAEAVLYLVSSKASYITGQTLSVDGGLAI